MWVMIIVHVCFAFRNNCRLKINSLGTFIDKMSNFCNSVYVFNRDFMIKILEFYNK